MQALNAAPADGQTIMVTASNILTEILLVMETGFDPIKDVKPVTMVARAGVVLVAAASVPASDLKGRTAYLKTTKVAGELRLYSVGASSQYAGMIFAKKNGLDPTHVPFVGSPPALQQLGWADRSTSCSTASSVDAADQGCGKLMAFGVASKTLGAPCPDVPTMAELGLRRDRFLQLGGHGGCRQKLPDDLVSRINLATVKAAMSPRCATAWWRRRAEARSASARPSSRRWSRPTTRAQCRDRQAFDIKLEQ